MSETALFEALPEASRTRLREAPPPSWTDPTLATLVHQPFSDPGWVFEPKLDGERCLAFVNGSWVRLMSRNRKDLGDTYPELVESIAEQASGDAVVDGEIVAFQGDRSSFARLQQRMQLSSAGEARDSGIAVYLYLFDIVHAAGHDVTDLPLRDRKAVLRKALAFRDPLRHTPYRNADGEDYYRQACRAGWEGVIAKDADAGYVQGRSRRWQKFKCVNQQELVIGGYTEPAGSRHGIGALLVGYYAGNELVYAGKVGTGFTEDTLDYLRGQLDERERTRSPFSGDVAESAPRWVRPELVAEIEFTEWTQDGKLRHPRYQGLRRDKDPTDVARERPT